MKGTEINILDRTKETTVTLCFSIQYTIETCHFGFFCITTDRADHEEFVIADFQTVLEALVNIFGFLRNHTHTHTYMRGF